MSIDRAAGGFDGRSGPLTGVRIVEFAGIGPGPFAAMLLADMGADVIRIDRPGGADPYSRHVVCRSRPSVTADLKAAPDRDEVLALLDHADALIEGFRPGVMERLGLGPDAVLARNPRLAYGRMTGWGQTGPLAETAGHDISYIAVTGALAAIGAPEAPTVPLNLVGDYGGGALYLALGLLAAVIQARETGRGQVVDAAICDGAASLMAMFCDLRAQGRWADRRGANLLDGGAPFYRTFRCADGEHVAIGPLEPRFFGELCDRLDLAGEEVVRRDDPAVWPALQARLEAAFLTRSREEWCAMFEGSDACLAPVLTLGEAPAHPHLTARRTYTVVDGVAQPSPAPRFSLTSAAIQPPRPQIDSLADAVSAWTDGAAEEQAQFAASEARGPG
ncbi:MAG: CoA transferase [Methylobacteriaceae bacterium]|nr:CoA transferase [Methylobacteriaceae bacterium]